MPLASFRSTYDTYCLLPIASNFIYKDFGTWDKKETIMTLNAQCSRGLNMHMNQINRNIRR